jgi:hypothetical protein
MHRPTVIVAAIALVLGGCGNSETHRNGARTFYESLDMSSPEAAVETLTDAFAADDFMTVWLMFDQLAQSRITTDINLLQYSRVIGPDAMDELRAWLSGETTFESLENLDQWYMFDQIMMIADRNDGFLIDLSGDVTITDTEPIADTVPSVRVAATVEGVDGDVVFVATAMTQDRWRIRRISVAEGDPVPLSIPSEDR